VSLAVDVATAFVAPGAERFVVDADFAVRDGETLVLLGPSGSGKTLLLETVAGFHDHEGSVRVDGRDLTGAPPEKREFGFVFQDYALFPHMTVRENVRFGEPYRPDHRDADALLDALGVADLAERHPETLSGGERQRVALARSLYTSPRTMLLDEPLSALDAPTRRSLRADVADALDGVTALYVTHDRTTARALADRIAVMDDGRIRQLGTPEDVFERPATPFVARFTGANVVSLGGARGDGGDRTGAEVAIRPEHVDLVAPEAGDLTGVVDRAVREDAAVRVTVALERDAGISRPTAAPDGGDSADGDGPSPTLDAFATDPPAPGDRVGLSLPDGRVTRFDG
jgi:ABC-type Fe3+/spermidine/putrescine transport system ATPase subunit